MLDNGWSHETLCAMPEADFMFWFHEQVALEEAKADAIEQAAKRK